MVTKSKKYKYQLNIGIIIMAILLFGIGLASILWTIYQMFVHSFSALLIVQYVIVLFFAILTITIATLILFFSCYRITNTAIILYFGFIQKKYPLQKIMAIKLFKQTNQLIIYHTLNENKYTVISISSKQYTEFVQNLLQENKQIIYEEISHIYDELDKK